MQSEISASQDVERRAESFAQRAASRDASAAELALALSVLDLTTLGADDTREHVTALCHRAVRPCGDATPPVAAVCVLPPFAAVAKATLAGTGVRVAVAAGDFPSGRAPLERRLAEIAAAVADGADEIDAVMNRAALRAGRPDVVREEIFRMREACGRAEGAAATLKIILETGALGSYDDVRRASALVAKALGTDPAPAPGAAFLKTSTGRVSPAATLPATLVMMDVVRDHFETTGIRLGVKPAGGIRTADQALAYLDMARETLGEAWLTPALFRLGASALADDLCRCLTRRAASA